MPGSLRGARATVEGLVAGSTPSAPTPASRDLMRILMWHFRSAPADRTRLTGLQDPGDSAGTDGVSLEMMKRRAMLEAEGHEVAVSSAYSWSEFPIAALEFDSDAVTTMMRNLFGSHIGDFDNEDALTQAFEASTAALRQDLRDVLEAFRGVVARIVTGPHDANRQDPHVPMRYDTGRPRAVIRFRISQPRTASLPCPAGLRARRPSPMRDL